MIAHQLLGSVAPLSADCAESTAAPCGGFYRYFGAFCMRVCPAGMRVCPARPCASFAARGSPPRRTLLSVPRFGGCRSWGCEHSPLSLSPPTLWLWFSMTAGPPSPSQFAPVLTLRCCLATSLLCSVGSLLAPRGLCGGGKAAALRGAFCAPAGLCR